MNRPVWAFLLLAIYFAGPAWSAEEMRQILVTIVQPKVSQLSAGGNPATRYARRSLYRRKPAVDRILDDLASDYPLLRRQGWLMRSLGVYCEVFEVAAAQDLAPLLAQLSADPRVDSAQPMYAFSTRAAEGGQSFPAAAAADGKPAFNDPYFVLQHSLPRLGVPPGHRMSTGAGVRIAIIDSGVNAEHPDLSRAIATEDFAKSHVAADGFHGTGLAGVIAARPNNALGIVGVAPDARILSLRACWGDTSAATAAQCSSFTLARALDRAIEAGVHVINLSLAGPRDPLLERLLYQAHRRGIFLVAASRADRHNFPAALPFVLGVDAESIRGGSVYAPGTDVMTTLPAAEFGYLSGSSLAAAHVSAVAALLVELNPSLAGPELLTLFESQPQVNACRLAASVVSQQKAADRTLDCG